MLTTNQLYNSLKKYIQVLEGYFCYLSYLLKSINGSVWILSGVVLSGLCIHTNLAAQQLIIRDSSMQGVSFRGLSVANEKCIWVSGSKGTIGKSKDAGATWQWVHPVGYEHRDFRDIEAFSADIALAVAVDSPGVILRTHNGGKSWQEVFLNNSSGVFLDDLIFGTKGQGICVGDPLADRYMMVVTTRDSGKSWQLLPKNQCPLLEPGEAMFAASGSNGIASADKRPFFWVATGGQVSRLWKIKPFQTGAVPDWHPLPIMQGGTYTGANAVARAGNYLMVAGGDFSKPDKPDSNFVVMYKNRPAVLYTISGGYFSGIADNQDYMRVGCSFRGVYFQKAPNPAYPLNWQQISTAGFHVVKTVAGSTRFWLAGPNGRIATVDF